VAISLKVYGLTGGIACGKSTVANFFRELGAAIIDADQIHHELCEKGEKGWKKIKEAFGDSVFNSDGTLNREKLGDIVFKDPKKKKLLEEISHPLIMGRIREEVKSFARKSPPFVLVEAALLIESNREKQFHGLVVVSCRKEQQVERLVSMRGISKERALAMIDAQMPIEEKVKHATFVIDNSGSLGEIKKGVANVFQEIQKREVDKLPLWN
jgi:dephospho-CoA kinase